MNQVKILVVDDEKDARDVMKFQLRQENYQFLEAENGEEAINTLRSKNNIDAILCDIRMPKMNGLECIDFINTEAPGIPVVVVTGYPDAELSATLMRKGVKGVLVKPVEKQTMVDTLNILVSLG